jgi:RNA polymerase sigma factor (sigma-70 family)
MEDHAACVEAAVRAHQRRLIALAYSILRSLDHAKDAAQDALIQLAKAHCPAIANKEAWLVTVCRRGALKLLARGRRSEPLTPAQAESLAEEGPGPGDSPADDPRLRALLDQLDALPEKQREVLRLHYFTGLRLAEIAAVLGGTANAVHAAHFAGLAALRRKLAPAARPPS